MKIVEVRIINLNPFQREVIFDNDVSLFIEGHDIVEVYDMDGILGYGNKRLDVIRKHLNVKFIEWIDGKKIVS